MSSKFDMDLEDSLERMNHLIASYEEQAAAFRRELEKYQTLARLHDWHEVDSVTSSLHHHSIPQRRELSASAEEFTTSSRTSECLRERRGVDSVSTYKTVN